MQDEKDISQMTPAELRAGLNQFFQPTAPAREFLPPGITPDMSQKAKDEASKLYLDSIMAKPAGALTQSERDFLRNNVNAALRELGY